MASHNVKYFEKDYKGALGYELPDNENQLFEIKSLPALNAEVFHKLYADDDWEDVLTEMLEIFIETLPEETMLIESAHDNHDWAKIEFMAHKIKGGCLSSGLERLAMACQFLERYIKAGHSQYCEKLYQQMLDTLKDAVPEVNKWLKIHH